MRTAVLAENDRHYHKTILVLQNDNYLAGLLQFLLKREGYLVKIIAEPGHAVLHFETHAAADLIFIDEHWIRKGHTALLSVLHQHPEWRRVPVICLMKPCHGEDLDRKLRVGVTDYLLQPFEPAGLLDQIQRYTGHVHSS